MKQKLPSFNPDSSFETSSLITCQSSEVIATKTVEREIKKIISLLEYKKLEFLSRDSPSRNFTPNLREDLRSLRVR